jgi:hypothetical protein
MATANQRLALTGWARVLRHERLMGVREHARQEGQIFAILCAL